VTTVDLVEKVDLDEFLIRTHSTLTAKQQSEQLGIDYSKIITRRMKLTKQGQIDLSKRAYLPPWSQQEDEFLESHYSRMTMKTLSEKLGRSETGIMLRRRRIGLHRTDGFYTATALAKIFGIDAKGVTWFAENGFLKGSRAPYYQGLNKPWYFSELNIRRFIRHYPWLLRPEKMDEHYFRSILRDEWKRDPWYSASEAAKILGCVDDTLLRHLHRGVVQGFKRQYDRKWGRWWIRRSALQGFWDKVRENKRQRSRQARKNYYRRIGQPTKLYTVWQVHCPSCGEDFTVRAPPRAHGPEVLALGKELHQCRNGGNQHAERF
jgi:rRNA maturation protein Nop10